MDENEQYYQQYLLKKRIEYIYKKNEDGNKIMLVNVLFMYSYCSSMYSYCCLYILRCGYPD